jgi:hypothetical protein
MLLKRLPCTLYSLLALPSVVLACHKDRPTDVEVTAPLSGRILIDGSSTSCLSRKAVAVGFNAVSPAVTVDVAESGTGGCSRRPASCRRAEAPDEDPAAMAERGRERDRVRTPVQRAVPGARSRDGTAHRRTGCIRIARRRDRRALRERRPAHQGRSPLEQGHGPLRAAPVPHRARCSRSTAHAPPSSPASRRPILSLRGGFTTQVRARGNECKQRWLRA